MSSRASPAPSALADGLFGLLNPIPFGCFVAAMIFDIVYMRSAVMLWNKGAAWLIVIGLFAAVIPRFVNLVQVWIAPRHGVDRSARLAFWLNLLAIVAAIFNAFVHSRDAFAVMPTGMWLSVCTVLLMAVGNIAVSVRHGSLEDGRHG